MYEFPPITDEYMPNSQKYADILLYAPYTLMSLLHDKQKKTREHIINPR